MNEDFLQYVWKFQLFNHKNLLTTSGDSIDIIHSGTQNLNSGPDFFNSKIKINNTIWAGNVEIHTQSSNWNRHKHQFDAAYNNVILHVVWEFDKPSYSSNGRELPVLVLGNRVHQSLELNYTQLINNQNWIACDHQISKVKEVYIKNWLHKILITRLERKSKAIEESLFSNQNNWEETFYQLLAKNFGFNINAQPFLMLSYSLPLKYLYKHRNSLFQIEALLFGQSGLLGSDFKDEYPISLKKEYDFLKNKYQLEPMEKHLWKFFRVRPSNFPTIRIAQFASLIAQSNTLFSLVLNQKDQEDVNQMLNMEASSYWVNHFDFDKKSKKGSKRMGRNSFDNLMINTIIPFLFVYGNKKQILEYKERALLFLEQISSERNNIVRGWENLGIKSRHAYDSQALIELKNEYCSNKKCLNCAIGLQILNLDDS